jgi:hypothetical protein
MSEVKVNKISPRSGTDVTLGDSGDTFTIPSGAAITIASGATINNNGTANNFGATGAVNWQTTVKTATFTATSGEGYFCNTSGGAFTVNLPSSPSAGAVVGVKDYANTWDTNNLTLGRGGSNIGGEASDQILDTEGLAVTLVYIDATKGWLVTDSGLQSQATTTTQYVTATGGTITTSGNCKIHTFTGPGTFSVSCAGNASGSNKVSYMVIAGGGGGAYEGGGAAGGYREGKDSFVSYTGSPLACTSGANAGLPVSVQSYSIAVGGGGAGVTGPGGPYPNNPGLVSTFSTITSTGGGAGANSPNFTADPGGSGGGGASGTPGQAPGGTGNTPPVSPPQGNNGGAYAPASPYNMGGGGGGAGGVGNVPHTSGGGIATTTSIPSSPTPLAGGGGGGGDNGSHGSNGHGNPGGGGGGGGRNGCGVAGTANTGGGGGGSWNNSGGNGGSGIVVIRYKFQN